MKSTIQPAQQPNEAVLIAVEHAELAGIETRSPEWDRARALLAGVFTTVRQSVAGWVFLGRELLILKQNLGFMGSGKRKTARAVFNSWADYTRSELGISDDMADRCIAAYKVIRHRGETILRDDSQEFRLLTAPPASLSQTELERLQEAVSSLVKADDTQRSLLREFRLLPKGTFGKGGDTTKQRKKSRDEGNPALVASAPFRVLYDELAKTDRAITRLRNSNSLDSYLILLPLTTDNPQQVIGLLDYVNKLNRIKFEIDDGLQKIAEKFESMAESKMKGEAPKRTRKKSSIIKLKK